MLTPDVVGRRLRSSDHDDTRKLGETLDEEDPESDELGGDFAVMCELYQTIKVDQQKLLVLTD